MTTCVVNSVIEWLSDEPNETTLERILWIDADTDQVFVILLDNKETTVPQLRQLSLVEDALCAGTAKKRVVDPFARIVTPDLRAKHKKRRDAAWEIIKDLVVYEPDIYDRERRGTLIRQASEQHGKDRKQIYRYLAKYWKGGMVKDALIIRTQNMGNPGKERDPKDKKLGRPSRLSKQYPSKTGVNVDSATREWFQYAIDHYYDTRHRYSLKRAYTLLIENHFNLGYEMDGNVRIPILPKVWEIPTFEQFKYYFNKHRDLRKSLISREGEKGYALRYRPILGDSKHDAMGPGDVYQIDATIADVYLVNGLDRSKIIGRPVIYVVVDVFSRMITGLYVGLEGPSWTGARMALANAFESKVAFCQQYGIEITEEEFPCRYLPKAIVGDRGEMVSHNSDVLSDAMNIRIINTPPYRADWKGIVEQQFRLANLTSIRWLPGAINERYRERGEPDHALDATLTLYEFTQIMIHTVMLHNCYHRMDWYDKDAFAISDEVAPIPIELWNWGIAKRRGRLREMSPDLIKVSLMPRDHATVTEEGIRFQGRFYSCDKAAREQWFGRARIYGRWTKQVSYDFRNVDQIYLVSQDGREFEVCTLMEKDTRFTNHRVEEVLDYFEYEKINAVMYSSTERQASAVHRAHVDAIVNQAKDQRDAARVDDLPKSHRKKGIRDNHAEERNKNREHEAWLVGQSQNEHSPSTNADDITEKLSEPRSKQAQFVDILKRQKEGQA